LTGRRCEKFHRDRPGDRGRIIAYGPCGVCGAFVLPARRPQNASSEAHPPERGPTKPSIYSWRKGKDDPLRVRNPQRVLAPKDEHFEDRPLPYGAAEWLNEAAPKSREKGEHVYWEAPFWKPASYRRSDSEATGQFELAQDSETGDGSVAFGGPVKLRPAELGKKYQRVTLGAVVPGRRPLTIKERAELDYYVLELEYTRAAQRGVSPRRQPWDTVRPTELADSIGYTDGAGQRRWVAASPPDETPKFIERRNRRFEWQRLERLRSRPPASQPEPEAEPEQAELEKEKVA
jgi:hypothetical protein